MPQLLPFRLALPLLPLIPGTLMSDAHAVSVGIVAYMAFDPAADKGLRAVDAAHLFESATTRSRKGMTMAWFRKPAGGMKLAMRSVTFSCAMAKRCLWRCRSNSRKPVAETGFAFQKRAAATEEILGAGAGVDARIGNARNARLLQSHHDISR